MLLWPEAGRVEALPLAATQQLGVLVAVD